MTIYLPPSARHFRQRWLQVSAWLDHVPFGYDIVAAVKPKLLVELGTHRGVSYFTFCQSISDHDIDCTCYAVDTWIGDEHVVRDGLYGKRCFKMVNKHNKLYYRGFSYLLRMMFSDALKTFPDSSIDLLHIDGLHTYEAVSEDFNSWLPKVSPGGIILIHDIAARVSSDFGVWKFWEEISGSYESFAFHNGFGLGILRKPGLGNNSSELLDLMFNSSLEEQEKLRAFYVHLSNMLDMRRHAGFLSIIKKQRVADRVLSYFSS